MTRCPVFVQRRQSVPIYYHILIFPLGSSSSRPPPPSYNRQAGRIEVHNPHRLASEVLHKYFRHSKFASFQRQLNYFGFRKFAGKGKMAPCSYVNEAATSDLRSLLLIKVRFAVLSREPKSRWVPTVVVVIVAVALNDRLLFLGSCTKMKTHKDTERAKKRERKTCTNSYTSESYPPTCILIF